MYDLSIITPLYNNFNYTEQYIQDVIEYTHSNYQLILIDNGSTDYTKNLLSRYKHIDNILIIRNSDNMGFGYANNQGISASNSKFICFMNNDVLLFRGWDSYLLKPFFKFNNIGAVGPVTNNCAGIQSDNYNLKYYTSEDYYDKALDIAKSDNHTYLQTHRIIGFCLLAESQLIKDIRGFDELFNIGNYEDDDLCIRINLSDKKILICENVFIYHYGSKTFENNNIDQLKSLTKNSKLFSNKWHININDDGSYVYNLEDLNRNRIVNNNYLIDSKCEESKIFTKDSDWMEKSSLTKLQNSIKKGNEKNIIKEFKKLIQGRPFHPEALLQMVDYYLSVNNEKEAKILITKLVQYTPKWNVVQNLGSHFGIEKQSINNPCLSICIITKNEEHNLDRCLKSLNKIINKQIIIVDTGSNDKTIEIAKRYDTQIYQTKWNNDFSEARNFALQYCTGDWILILDADEELAPDVSETLIKDFAQSNILGYRLPLENIGSPLNGFNYVPRLVRNAPGLHFIGKIHETIFASILVLAKQWNMEQAMGNTKILHHGYTPDEMQRKGKLKRNLSLYEDALAELPDEPSIMMNYAHDLNHDGQTEKAYVTFKKIHGILEQHKTEDITPEVREQFIHNYGVFLAQEHKMKELADVMFSRTARDTGPVANVHYMAGLGLINCKRYDESIRELEFCIQKAYEDSLAPSIPDVRSWKPRHLLANAYASLGNEKEAIRNWEEVLVECKNSLDPFHDYARFLSSLNRNKEALEILIKSLDYGLNGQQIWELGAGIVNSDPELAAMALDWTEEAVQYFPESDVTNVRRGEALMKNGRYLEAIPFFERLTSRGERNATAAQLICKKMLDQLSTKDLDKVGLVQNELKGWTEIMDKAPGEFNRELAEQLIQ